MTVLSLVIVFSGLLLACTSSGPASAPAARPTTAKSVPAAAPPAPSPATKVGVAPVAASPAGTAAASPSPAAQAAPAPSSAAQTSLGPSPAAKVSPSPAPAASTAVLASFYPLEEVSRRVGGDRAAVANLVAAGGEPHDLELTPRDVERLRQARLLVYIGAGFQPGLERAVQSTRSPGLTALDVTLGMTLLASTDEGDDPGTAGQAAQRGQDPHVWLDPIRMKDIAAMVRDELTRIDPAGRDTFAATARAYQAEMDALDQEIRQGLQGCRRQDFVTSHAAFSYFAQRYGLEQKAITGLSPENEPSPRRLQELIRYARQNNAQVIYSETLVDPKVAETIAREVGARTLVLNPIEGLTQPEQAQGRTYRDLMRQNVANLRIGLECS